MTTWTRRWTIGAATALVALGAACGGVGPFEPGSGQLSITLADPVLDAVGATTRVAVQLGDGVDLSPDQPVAWSSGDPSVVTVDDDGVVTAMGDGTTTVRASLGGASDTATITVAATIVTTVRVTATDVADDDTTNDVATASLTVTVD